METGVEILEDVAMNLKNSFSVLTAAMCLAALTTVAVPAQTTAGMFEVVDHWKIGGEGGWDYLLADPSSHVVYVTHGPRVEIVDTRTGKSVGRFDGLQEYAWRSPGPDWKVWVRE